MREILHKGNCLLGALGITPAYAGNTTGRTAKIQARAGSPPRMREIPLDGVANRYLIWDHPRVCGKYTKKLLILCHNFTI